MPDYTAFESEGGIDYSAFGSATQQDMQSASVITGPGKKYGTMATLAGDIGLGAIDLLDTAASSIPGLSRATGMTRGVVNQKALNLIGRPGLTEFYQANKEGIEVASGIGGVIAAGMLTKKLTAIAAPFAEGLKTLPFARRILALDSQYQEAMNSLRAADTAIAATGLQGAQAFTAAATVPVSRWTKAGLETATELIGRDMLATSARRLGAAKNILDAAAVEGVMALTLNSNSFLYPEDYGQMALQFGLGLALPGLVGAVTSNYAAKRFLQSDMIARTRAGALDPSGLETKVMGAFGKGKIQDKYLGGLQGTRTDAVTSWMVQADARMTPGVDQSTFGQLVTARQSTAFTEAEKVTQAGIMGLSDSSFVIGKAGNTSAEGRMIKESLKRDPGALYGVEMVGKVGDDMSFESAHMAVGQRMDEELMRSQKAVDEEMGKIGFDPQNPSGEFLKAKLKIKQLRWAKNTTPSLLIDGERVPLSYGKVYDNWVPNKIKQSKAGDDDIWESVDAATGKLHGISIDQNLTLFGKKFGQQDQVQRLQTFRVANQAIKKLSQRAVNDPTFAIQLPKNANWFQLDMAEQILKQTEGRAKVMFPRGMDRDMAQVESLAQKTDELMKSGIDLQGDAGAVALARVKYNLPRLTAYQMGLLGSQNHPLDVLLRGAMAKGGGDALRGMSLTDLKMGFTQAKRIDDLSSMSARDVDSLSGDSFNFLLDGAGNELKPALVYSRPLKPHDWTRDSLADRIAVNKMQQMKALTGGQASRMIQTLAGSLYGSADLDLAASLSKLSDLQLAPSTPGIGNIAPTSVTGAAINSVTSQSWRARFSAPMQAMTRLKESADRYVRGYAKEMFETSFGDRLDRLAAPNTLETKVLLDQWFTPGMSSGWDIHPQTGKVAGQGGKEYHGFTLELTESNKARFEKQFGRPLKKGQVLLSPQGKPVVVDQLGMDILESTRMITDDQRLNQNTVLRSQGMQEIKSKPWYVPPPNLEGKYIAMTFDATGKSVPGGMIIASTEAELEKEIARLKGDKNSVANQLGNIVRKRQEIEDYGSVWDRAQMNMVDANATVVKGGKTNAGLNAAPGTVSGSFQTALEQLRNNYHNMSRDVMETVLSDQIKMAQHRATLSAGEVRSRTDNYQGVTHRSTYDYWLQELRGSSPLSSSGSFVGPTYNRWEGNFNRFMAERAPGASQTWHNMTDWVSKRMPWSSGVQDRAAFEKLSTDLAKFMPFQSVTEALEKRGYASNAWTLSDFTGKANQLTATWMLRMLEVVHPLMNMAGVVNAMPSVIRQFTPLADETAELFAQRIGHSATIFKTPSGKSYGVMDMGKLVQRGIQDSMNPDPFMRRFQEHTRKVGMRGQEVAEFSKQMSAIESKSTAQKFINGDAKDKNPFMRKGVIGWLSILSDKSEDFSRAVSLDVGARLGRDLGINDVDSLANFSHDFANRMIADYSPHNRPEIFQGAVGAPIGLFQSFMWNYYERMFRYLETGDYKNFAMQSAMQGTLFGAATIPGFDKVQALFMSQSEGESSPYDGLVRKFGHDAGDLLMAGTLSNIPKLFGEDGMNLYSRGDTAARLPGLSTPAAFSVLSKIKDGIGAAADIFSERNPEITGQQIGEILSNMIPNRPMAGMVETLLAGGKDTDGYGQLVSENLDAMESTYRMLGVRSIRQSKDLEAFYGNKQQMEIKASKDEILREGSRSLIRAQGEDALPKLFENYVENGGDARNFTRWYRENYEAATETRSERQLDKLMKDPSKMGMVNRLIEADVGQDEENQEDDPFGALTGQDPMDGAQPKAREEDPNLAYQF